MFLAMGGIALGKAVASSGLLDVLGEHINNLVSGLPLISVVVVLSCVVLVSAMYASVVLTLDSFECLGCVNLHKPYNSEHTFSSDCKDCRR